VNFYLKLLFLNILITLPFSSLAGQITDIDIDHDTASIIINHQSCDLSRPIEESRKLILPLYNCTAKKGIKQISHPLLKKVHWAQHNKHAVWVVMTFKHDYQFEIQNSLLQTIVCIPKCIENITVPSSSLGVKKALSVPPTIVSSKTDIADFMFKINDTAFQIPLEDVSIDEFLDLSIGHLPKAVVQDGLPHFGSKRDDWKGHERKHQGYDIYKNNVDVLATAEGVVTKVVRNDMAGLYVKLRHGGGIYTVYVHLTSTPLKRGKRVKQGEIIGRIDGASGNAVAPQLHFEIKLGKTSIDPLPLIENYYQNDIRITNKIKLYKNKISKYIEYRDQQVQAYLKAKK